MIPCCCVVLFHAGAANAVEAVRRTLSRQQEKTFDDRVRDATYGYRQVRPGYKSLSLKWDKECPSCGRKYLSSASSDFRKKCCWEGNSAERTMPKLEPLSPAITDVLHGADFVAFAAAAVSYNNILSLGKCAPLHILCVTTTCSAHACRATRYLYLCMLRKAYVYARCT
jgi:hypothetical protein